MRGIGQVPPEWRFHAIKGDISRHGNTMAHMRHISMVVNIAHYTAFFERTIAAIVAMMKMQTVPARHLFFHISAAEVFAGS